MVEYRPIPEGEHETFHEYVRYAFQPERGPPDGIDVEELPERGKLGAERGLYEDGAPADADPLAVCAHHWFDARVRGDVHPVPGLSMVASPPEHRRQGYVRELLRESLAEYRERGARFSVLWPFKYPFYRAYGWDTSNRTLTFECDPEALSFAADGRDERGEYRRLEADEYDRLAPVYEAHAADYALALERDEEWWRHRVFAGWEEDPYVYAWLRDGEVRGYLVYRIDGDWGDRTMRVSERAFVDREAYLALLAFCANHDSQVRRVRVSAPADDPLADVAADPDELDCELETGPMVRIVDVTASLEALSYPEDARVDLAIAVSDPLVEANDGRFALRVADGVATCDLAPDADPDARIDVAALSQLAVGYRSAGELRTAGRLEADGPAVDALEAAFPTRAVYLRDGF